VFVSFKVTHTHTHTHTDVWAMPWASAEMIRWKNRSYFIFSMERVMLMCLTFNSVLEALILKHH